MTPFRPQNSSLVFGKRPDFLGFFSSQVYACVFVTRTKALKGILHQFVVGGGFFKGNLRRSQYISTFERVFLEEKLCMTTPSNWANFYTGVLHKLRKSFQKGLIFKKLHVLPTFNPNLASPSSYPCQ